VENGQHAGLAARHVNRQGDNMHRLAAEPEKLRALLARIERADHRARRRLHARRQFGRDGEHAPAFIEYRDARQMVLMPEPPDQRFQIARGAVLQG